jgi:hypothetical protein
MANTPDLASCLAESEMQPLNPFYSLRYHFGMLLGVDDFETEQAYHRAKMRLHNAWLHRAGAVWGLGVAVDTTRGEILVTPGLALDAQGRELHLEADACLNVGAWFEQHEDDVTLNEDGSFDAHIVIRFAACLTRQVPALLEPCVGSGNGTAYSRVFETVELLLLPGLAPAPVPPYHRLRLLFGLDAPQQEEGATTPDDQAVLDAMQAIRALPVAEQTAAWLTAFHRFAALDEIALKPAQSEDGARTLLFPGRDDEAVVLANIAGLKLTKSGANWTLGGGAVDVSVRPSHVATTTMQDLLCGVRGGAIASPGDVGPRVDAAAVTISDTEIILKADQPILAPSVTTTAFAVTVFDDTTGWQNVAVTPTLNAATNEITLKLDAPPLVTGLTRIIARGTGAEPILGQNKLPLSGTTTDVAVPQGADFVWMKVRN